MFFSNGAMVLTYRQCTSRQSYRQRLCKPPSWRWLWREGESLHTIRGSELKADYRLG